MPQDQPLTGFEGVQDSLLYDTLQQAQYQQRVLQQRQMADPFDRAIDAFGGLLQIGVNELAPPLAERNARAVSTARANALRTVEGQEFDSPYLRQVAVVEAAADELDSQGLGSSAAQLRANALALRTQAMEFKKLNSEVTKADAEAITEAARAANAPRLFAAQAEGEEAQTALRVLDYSIKDATAPDLVAQARLQTQQDEQDLATKVFNNTTGRQLEIDNLRSQIGERQARIDLAARADAREAAGKAQAIALADGRIVAATIPPGSSRAVYEERDPRTGQVVQKVALGSEYTPVSLSGGRNDVSETTRRMLSAQAVGTTTAIRNLTIARDILVQSQGQAGTGVGKLAQVLAGARTEVRAAVQAAGGTEATQNIDAQVEKFLKANEDQLDNLERSGARRDVLEAVMSDILFNIATSREGGRVTDQDVNYAGVAAGFGAGTVTGRIAAMDNMAYQMRQATHDRLSMAGMEEPRSLIEVGKAYGEAIGRAPVPNPGNRIFDAYYQRVTRERQQRLRQGGTVQEGTTRIRAVQ